MYTEDRSLDETLAVLHWCPDTVFQRRFARYATAIVLHHCGELGRDFWSWSTREWGDLLRPQQLRQRFAGQVGMQARPYLLAHAYLLAGPAGSGNGASPSLSDIARVLTTKVEVQREDGSARPFLPRLRVCQPGGRWALAARVAWARQGRL